MAILPRMEPWRPEPAVEPGPACDYGIVVDPAKQVRQLLIVNARQVAMIERLEEAVTHERRIAFGYAARLAALQREGG